MLTLLLQATCCPPRHLGRVPPPRPPRNLGVPPLLLLVRGGDGLSLCNESRQVAREHSGSCRSDRCVMLRLLTCRHSECFPAWAPGSRGKEDAAGSSVSSQVMTNHLVAAESCLDVFLVYISLLGDDGSFPGMEADVIDCDLSAAMAEDRLSVVQRFRSILVECSGSV